MKFLARRTFLKTCGLASAGFCLPVWGADRGQSLFDGQSLKGWHKPPKRIAHGTGGHWWVEDGVLLGEQDPPGSGNGGLLLSDEKFGDFDLQLEMCCDYGPDTGVFFRCTDRGEGFQMYVDYHEGGNVGHLRGELGNAFALSPFRFSRSEALMASRRDLPRAATRVRRNGRRASMNTPAPRSSG